MKTRPLLLLLSLALFLSCEKEFETVNTEPSLVEKLMEEFDHDTFSQIIPYEFEVDWSSYTESFSEEFDSRFYEFGIRYTSDLNPETVSDVPNKKFTVFVLELGKGEHTFFVADFQIIEGDYGILQYARKDNFTGNLRIRGGRDAVDRQSLYVDGIAISSAYTMTEREFKEYKHTAKMVLEDDDSDCYGNDCEIGGA